MLDDLAKRAMLGLVRLGFRLPEGPAAALDGYVALKRLIADLGIDCVLDVGANKGQFAQGLRMIGYRGLICSFEPARAAFGALTENFAADRNWRGFNVGMGDKRETKPLKLVPNSVYNSFLEPAVPMGKNIPVQPAEIHRLDAFLPTVMGDWNHRRILLKMDTQGFDPLCFDGAAGCLGSILALQSELSVQPLYHGMTHYTKSIDIYEAAGFELVGLSLVGRTRGAIQEMNCLMRRSEVRR